MAWFRKESRTKFVRDSSGKVVRVEREGEESENVRDERRNEKRYQRQLQREQQARDRRDQREDERKAFREARSKERIRLKQEAGRRAAQHPITGLLPPRKVVHVHVNRSSHHQKHTRQVQRKRNSYNFHPTDPMEFQRNMMKKWRI